MNSHDHGHECVRGWYIPSCVRRVRGQLRMDDDGVLASSADVQLVLVPFCEPSEEQSRGLVSRRPENPTAVLSLWALDLHPPHPTPLPPEKSSSNWDSPSLGLGFLFLTSLRRNRILFQTVDAINPS